MKNCLMTKIYKWAAALIIGLTFILQTSLAQAATTLKVTQIGASTPPASFTTWTYTSVNPVILGTAAPNAQVKVSLNDAISTLTANATGEWSFAPVTLIAGTHQVVITSGTETLSFSLTIAPTGSALVTPTATPAATTTSSSSAGRGGGSSMATGSAKTLPTTGTKEYLLGLIGFGALLATLGVGFKLVQAELEKSDST